MSTSYQKSEANAANTITYAAIAGTKHTINGIAAVAYSATPTAGLFTIKDGDDIIFEVPITAAGPAPIALSLEGTANTAMTVTMAAGGPGIYSYINITGKSTA
jgi:hypothetical protein